MQIAHVMVMAAVVLPGLTVGLAKFGGGTYDNAKPRAWLGALEGWQARADWAHRNGFEALPGFAAGVILAEMAHAPQATIDTTAMVFIAARVAYTAVYIANLATIRTLVWTVGLACTLRLIALSF